jgi:multiple sugar transport system permease protein
LYLQFFANGQLFRNLSWELKDAARVYGCGSFRVNWRIILPLTTPAIAVTVLLFVWHWKDFFEPNIYLTSEDEYTLPMMLPRLYQSLNETSATHGMETFGLPTVMVATFLVVAPLLLVYLFLQKYFIQGVERTELVE